jgi:hypothetical protein
MHEDDRQTFEAYLHHAVQQIHWRVLEASVPALAQTLRGAGEVRATHEGILELPGVGRVKAYRLSTGEAVFEAEEICRLFGLDGPADEGEDEA